MEKLSKLSSALTSLGLVSDAKLVKSAFLNGANIVVNKTPGHIMVSLHGETSYGQRKVGESSAYILHHILASKNLVNGKHVWHQDRSVDKPYIGLGYGRDMMCALHEAIFTEDGVGLSNGDVSDMARKNNQDKLGAGFKVTRVCVLCYMSEKWLLEADFDNVMALIDEKIFSNWDHDDISHVRREVENGIWNAVSEDYYEMPSYDLGGSGIKIETGLMIEWRGAKSSIPVKLDTSTEYGYNHLDYNMSPLQRDSARKEIIDRDEKVLEIRGLKPKPKENNELS